MDNNTTIITIKGGAFVSSSSLIQGMVIFNDPIYLVLGGLGSMFSLLGLIKEVRHTRGRKNTSTIIYDMVHAFLLGALLTPMYFIGYIFIGEILFYDTNIVTSESCKDVALHNITNSIWFLFALITSWYTTKIMTYNNFISVINNIIGIIGMTIKGRNNAK